MENAHTNGSEITCVQFGYDNRKLIITINQLRVDLLSLAIQLGQFAALLKLTFTENLTSMFVTVYFMKIIALLKRAATLVLLCVRQSTCTSLKSLMNRLYFLGARYILLNYKSPFLALQYMKKLSLSFVDPSFYCFPFYDNDKFKFDVDLWPQNQTMKH